MLRFIIMGHVTVSAELYVIKKVFITTVWMISVLFWSLFLSQNFNDSESEDVLHTVNPNEVFNESDSGTSDILDPTHCLTLATPTVYQVVYDLSGVGGDQQKEQKVDVISIELGVSTTNASLSVVFTDV